MEVIYLNSEKTEKFIRNLDNETINKVRNVIDLLKLHGNKIDMPDSKSLGRGLFELRTHGKVQVRVLYIFHNNKAFIIHHFVKRTWRINYSEINYARKIQAEIMRLV